MRRPPPPLSLLLPLAAAPACGRGLPDPDFVAYPRILAMELSVEEAGPPPDEGTRVEALPFESVTLVPRVAGPDGPFDTDTLEALSPAAFACTLLPGQGVGGCLLGKRPLDPEAIPDCPIPDGSDLAGFDPDNPNLSPPPSPCRLTEGTGAAPRYTLPIDPLFLLGSDVELTWVAGLAPASTADCEAMLLGEPGTRLSTDCLVGTRRLAVGPDSTLAALAGDLGVPVDAPPPPDPPEDPDRNPVVTEVLLGLGGDTDPVPYTEGDVLEIPIDTIVEVQVHVAETSEQTYLVVEEGAGGKSYVPRTERLSGDFASTWGYIEYGDSQGLVHRNLWTLSAAEEQPQKTAGDTVHLFVVVRDDRTGSRYVHVPVQLAPPLVP